MARNADIKAFCIGCGKEPEQISIYVRFGSDLGISAEDYVWREEGTLNRENGHFLCDRCYINAGFPSAPGGWKAP